VRIYDRPADREHHSHALGLGGVEGLGQTVKTPRAGHRKVCARHGGAVRILFTDKELTYKVLAKQLRISDRKVLDAAYDEEIKVMEPRLEFKTEAFQAILDETAKVDPRAKKIKPQDLIDRRYIDGMEKNGFFDKLWAGK
jgi:hypothetical protein